jgi:hypothetical protein
VLGFIVELFNSKAVLFGLFYKPRQGANPSNIFTR